MNFLKSESTWVMLVFYISIALNLLLVLNLISEKHASDFRLNGWDSCLEGWKKANNQSETLLNFSDSLFKDYVNESLKMMLCKDVVYYLKNNKTLFLNFDDEFSQAVIYNAECEDGEEDWSNPYFRSQK